MKYLACLVPMLACVEVLSYACLCALVIMFAFDLFIVGVTK